MTPPLPHGAQVREQSAPSTTGESALQAQALAQKAEVGGRGLLDVYCQIPETTSLSAREQDRIRQASAEAQQWIDTAVTDAKSYLGTPERQRDPNTERLAEELVIAADFLTKFLPGLNERPDQTLQLITNREAQRSLSLKLSSADSAPLATYKRDKRINLDVRQVEIDFTFEPDRTTDYTTKAIKFRLTNDIGEEIACWRLEMHSQEGVSDDKQEIQIDVTNVTFPGGERKETKYKHQPLISLGTGSESLENLGNMQNVIILNLTQQLLSLHLNHPASLKSHASEHEKDLKQLLKAHNAARQNLGMEKTGDSLASYRNYLQEEAKKRQEASAELQRVESERQNNAETIEKIRTLTMSMVEIETMRALRQAAEDLLGSRINPEDVPDADLAACLILDIAPQRLTPALLTSLNGHVTTLEDTLAMPDLPLIPPEGHPILEQAAESIRGNNQGPEQQEAQLAALSRLAAAQKMMELAHPE